MRRFIIFPGAVLATFALVLATAGTSQGAFDKDELKCRKGIAKNFSKAIATAQKITSGCHKSRNAGKTFVPSDNCNDLAVADIKNKFSKAQAKIAGQIQKCIDSGIDNDIRLLFISCPEPCGTDLALPNPVANYTDLGSCLACYAGEVGQSLTATIQGSPAGVPMASKDDQKCHQSIGKGYGKLLKTILKDRTKCQNSADKAGAMTVAETGCASSDLKGKIAKAVTKAAAGITKSCGAATLANLDSCDASSTANLIACLDTATNTSGDTAMPANYELVATICPAQLNSTIMSGNTTALGPVVTATRSFLEVGWTGLAHNADIPDNYTIGSELSCPGSPPTCGDCTITGLAASAPQYSDFTRCENDFSVPCSTPFTSDPACGGAQCKYILGPPLPLAAGNNPTCSVNVLNSDITGTANPDVGSGLLSVDLRTRVFLGANLSQPCPTCGGTCTAPLSKAGDSCTYDRDCNSPAGTVNGVCGNFDTPRDGSKDGTCSGGAKDGSPCDISGFSASFAPRDEGVGLSLDCPPDLSQNISGTGLKLGLGLTTGATSLAANNACDSPLGFLSCFCGQCSGDSTQPCRDDAECATAGAGTCTTSTGVPRVPNPCAGFACSDVGDDKGECTTGPDNSFCDGEIDANGDGYLGCLSNSDCDTINVVCGDGAPGSCGLCGISRRRACFLDPIVDQGVTDVDNPLLVSTFCLPPTNNTSINGLTGSPGPVRIGIDMLSELLF